MSTENFRSSTGAQTPLRESKQASGEILGFVDYISCTFRNYSLDEMTEFLGGSWYRTSWPRNGYQQGLHCGGIELWYHGRSDMGVNLVAKGAGCRELEMRTITKGWRVFIGDLLARGAQFSRLDIALDDYTGLLSIAEIGRCNGEGLACCRFGDGIPIYSNIPASRRRVVSGYTFGSRESRTMVRIYNKALQQGNEEHHVRVELETKGSKAKILAQRLSVEGENVIPGVIYKALDFKVEGKGLLRYRYRWKTEPWWSQFLGEVAKINLSVAPAERTLEKSMKAMAYQYGMTMARVVDVYGTEKLLAIAKAGKFRLERKRFHTKKQRGEAC